VAFFARQAEPGEAIDAHGSCLCRVTNNPLLRRSVAGDRARPGTVD
jgi:hypothetical protein